MSESVEVVEPERKGWSAWDEYLLEQATSDFWPGFRTGVLFAAALPVAWWLSAPAVWLALLASVAWVAVLTLGFWALERAPHGWWALLFVALIVAVVAWATSVAVDVSVSLSAGVPATELRSALAACCGLFTTQFFLCAEMLRLDRRRGGRFLRLIEESFFTELAAASRASRGGEPE